MQIDRLFGERSAHQLRFECAALLRRRKARERGDEQLLHDLGRSLGVPHELSRERVGCAGARNDLAFVEKAERLRTRLRTIDRRMEDQFSAAAKGRVTHDQLQKLSLKAAAQRLELEEELEDNERRIADQADASERVRARKKALAALLDGWGMLSLPEKQSLLREVVDRVVVQDDGLQVMIRP